MSSTHRTIDAAHTSRELASREGDGVHVQLLWHPQDNTLTVSVEDARVGECFEFAVERDRGLEAFYHPFASTGARNGVHHDDERQALYLRQQV
jgi:hypothetical protein